MVSARWWTLAVWALAAASAAFWGLKIFVQPPPAPPHTRTADATTALRGDLSRLLGADAAPAAVAAAAEPPPDARFQLVGVVSPRSPQASSEGVAVIAVDGKPPRAFRIGAVVDGQNVLQTVDARGATLGPAAGAAQVALKLAPPAPAATGTPGTPGAPDATAAARAAVNAAARRSAAAAALPVVPPPPPPAVEAPQPAAPEAQPAAPQPPAANAQRM